MSFKWTDLGLDFFEGAIIDSTVTAVFDTVAVGTGTNSPSGNDTTLDNQVYQGDKSGTNVTIERGPGTGEIRTTIEITGGTEVPSGSDITEIGFFTDVGDLIYREVRSTSITVGSGESKVIEIRTFVEDVIDDDDEILTTNGLNYVANRVIGETTAVINAIAIGSGTGTVSASDTTLANEIYRGYASDSNVALTQTSNIGEVRAEITISAGSDSDDEVAAGAGISEFGLFTDTNILVFHEKRAVLTLKNNDTKTFNIPLNIIQ